MSNTATLAGPPDVAWIASPPYPWHPFVPAKFRPDTVSTSAKTRFFALRFVCNPASNCFHSLSIIASRRGCETYRVPGPYRSSLTSLSYAEMVFATVPEAPPTIRNHLATSWPAPISANDPKIESFRLIVSAFWCVPTFSSVGICVSPCARENLPTPRENLKHVTRAAFVFKRSQGSSSTWMNERAESAPAESVAEEFLDPGDFRVRQVVIPLRVRQILGLQCGVSLCDVHLHPLLPRAAVAPHVLPPLF